MANNNFYVVEKEINGKTYKAQFCGVSAALRAVDESYIEGSGNTGLENLAKYVFDNIIVEPKGLTPDSFDSIKEFQEVFKFAKGVMQGEFREAENKGAAKKASEK